MFQARTGWERQAEDPQGERSEGEDPQRRRPSTPSERVGAERLPLFTWTPSLR